MRRTKEEAEATRQSIFKTALKVFSRKGYSATRLEDIAKQAGVTRGAIYWHFKNKFDLYYSLMAESFSGYEKRVKEIVETKGAPLDRIRKLMKETLVSLEMDEEYRAAEEIMFFKTELTDKLEDPMQEIVNHNQWLKSTMESLIKDSIKSGEINPDTNPRIAALALISYLNGLEMTWLMDTTAFSINKSADDLIEFQLRSIMN